MAEEDPNLHLEDGGGKKKRGLFMQCIGKIWRLEEDKIAGDNDEELNVKQTFKELVIYMVYIVFVCIIAFMMVDTNMFYYTKVMHDLFTMVNLREGDPTTGHKHDPEDCMDVVDFNKITTVSEFWEYTLHSFIAGLYWTKWYNGESDPSFEKLIYYENKLLGPPRIRQIRVSPNSCDVNADFSRFIKECYAEYSPAYEDKKPISTTNTVGNGTDTTMAWKYRTEEELNTGDYGGDLATYPGGGYALDLSMTGDKTLDRLKVLYNEDWIRRGSRATFLSFGVYNANINLFCVITLCCEFPATGGALPTHKFQTVKLLRYVTTTDYFVLACECVVLLFTLYYTVEEIIEVHAVGLVYFLDFWNILDVVLIAMALVCAALDGFRYTKVNEKMEKYKATPLEYHNFEQLASLDSNFNDCVAGLVFIAWVKVFKYISFNKTMTQLSTTLSRCAKDLLGFLIMFAIVFVAFTQLGYLLFGTQVEDFSTFLDSFFTLFRIILGDFDFHQLEEANRVLGPIFFMLFVFFVFFVLINMFLAIINDTYSEVKSDMAKQDDVFIMADYFSQVYNKVCEKLFHKRHEKAEVKGDRDQNHQLTHDELKKELMRQGYEEGDVDEVFKKHDVDKDSSLDNIEQNKILDELLLVKGQPKVHKADANEGEDEGRKMETNPAADAFGILARRVERLELSMGTIVANIDNILGHYLQRGKQST